MINIKSSKLTAIIGIIFIITSSSLVSTAQSKYAIKSYKSVDVHNARGVELLSNGNYLVMNEALDYTTQEWGTYFFEIDKTLNLVNVKFADYLGQTGPVNMIKFNNKYLACGSSSEDITTIAHAFVSYFDELNNDIVSFNIGEMTLTTRLTGGIQLNNGNILLYGRKKPDSTNIYRRLYTITLDEDLNELGDTMYINAPYNNLRSYFKAITPTNDGHYMLLATVNDLYSEPPGDVMLFKINETGNILWEQLYDYGDNEEGSDILSTIDGGIVFTTTNNVSDTDERVTRIVKLIPEYETTTNNIDWSLDTFFTTGFANKVLELADGSLLVAGHFYPQSSEYVNPNDGQIYLHASLLKISSDGTFLWQRIYDTYEHSYILDMMLEQYDTTGKSGYVLCGRNDSTDADYAYLLKLNCMGLLTEPQASLHITQDSLDAFTYHFTNTSQYTYPDSIDGGYYLLHYGDGTPAQTITTDSLSQFSHTYQAAGVYNASLTAIVCNDTSIYQQQICIGVNTLPFASFTYTQQDSVFTFTNTSQYTYPESGSLYHWQFGDGSTISNQQNPTHTYAASGVYNVTLTAIVCNDTSTYTHTVEVYPVGIEENVLIQKRAYPNPAKTILYIPYALAQEGVLNVYNVQGILVHSVHLEATGTYALSLENCKSGLYFYELKTTDKLVRKEKVVIVK